MITIQSAMLVALGFLCASFFVVLIAPAYWRRAVRLTSKRLKETLPISEAEIRADKDKIRAQFAIHVHRLESQVKDSKMAVARRLIEINRRDASISGLETELERLKASLEENQNARRVLEQTVADRLPKVEQRLAEAKRLLFNRDRDIAGLGESAKKQEQALLEAVSINAQQSAQIDRLNMTLATRGAKARTGIREPGFEIELALRSELEALRAKSRDQAALIGRLQGQIGLGYGRDKSEHAYAGGEARRNNGAAAEDAEIIRLKRSLSETEKILEAVAAGELPEGPDLNAIQHEMRQLKAKAQDQAGEIARLKAALATFENAGDETKSGSIRDSKLALKSRLNAVHVQAEQQAHVIAQLRAELAAAHERTALQAQHFKTQMRRLGSGTIPAAGVAPRPKAQEQRESLADQISQPRAAPYAAGQPKAAPPPAPRKTPPAASAPNGTETQASKPQVAKRQASKQQAAKPLAAKPLAVKPLAVKPLAVKPLAVKPLAVKPKAAKPKVETGRAPRPARGSKPKEPKLVNGAGAAGESQVKAPSSDQKAPRKSRLLDRITSLSED